jgi:hypothetical protein
VCVLLRTRDGGWWMDRMNGINRIRKKDVIGRVFGLFRYTA